MQSLSSSPGIRREDNFIAMQFSFVRFYSEDNKKHGLIIVFCFVVPAAMMHRRFDKDSTEKNILGKGKAVNATSRHS